MDTRGKILNTSGYTWDIPIFPTNQRGASSPATRWGGPSSGWLKPGLLWPPPEEAKRPTRRRAGGPPQPGPRPWPGGTGSPPPGRPSAPSGGGISQQYSPNVFFCVYKKKPIPSVIFRQNSVNIIPSLFRQYSVSIIPSIFRQYYSVSIIPSRIIPSNKLSFYTHYIPQEAPSN